jgi:hypothetical protein
MLRSQFEIMKDRNNLKWNLEWVSKNSGESSLKGTVQADNFEKYSINSKRSDLIPKQQSNKLT